MNRRGFNPFRRASDSALVAFVPLVRRLVISPDSFEPANEARLGRFHKSSHGSLLYVHHQPIARE